MRAEVKAAMSRVRQCLWHDPEDAEAIRLLCDTITELEGLVAAYEAWIVLMDSPRFRVSDGHSECAEGTFGQLAELLFTQTRITLAQRRVMFAMGIGGVVDVESKEGGAWFRIERLEDE